ncbi:hypothetical protein PQ455_08990 [Sphingomonas naphthae]|uniref:Alpha/beta hydrolase n=1 Tax=Sphingomonas naphthae TaxID=1813468 RepID=A0ABY7TQ20_9SPHN|nr:hypothetical protein [Sphingomonas naphthae]WCT75334.1 hypothetical protein PQ455_08990 [Sphingomonas naphthae]
MASFKRKCFYLSGFDPRGAPHYHRMYAEQVEKHGRLAGETITVSRRRTINESIAGWQVVNETAGVETDYYNLRWDDLVRTAWIREPIRLVVKGLATYWRYLTQSDWPRVLALPRHPLTTLYYPLAAMLLIPLLLILLATGLLAIALPLKWALPIAILAGVAGAIPLLIRMRALWLVRLYVFNDALARGRDFRGMDERLDGFVEAIAEALASDADEVLVITHSNGSIIAVPLMDRLIARMGGTLPAKFALVTFGQCIPLVALRRDAGGYREKIRAIAATDFHWYDFSFPADGACYAMVDPFALGEPKVVNATMHLLSPRFFAFYEADVYQALRKQKYELHFDYLRCQDRISPASLLSLTAGPRPIAESVAAFRAIP